MLESSGPRARAALVILVLAAVLIPHATPLSGAASPNQPSTFYFHKQSSKTINTVTSVLWSNTTQLWSLTTQTESRTGAKGTPAIWDFYTQPVMAGAATFTGPLTFTLFLSSSGNTGTGTAISGTVSEVTPTGTVFPLAVASLSNAPLTPTISIVTLTIVSNTYAIPAGSNFDFTVSINIAAKGSQTLTLYYDVPTYKSQVSVTFQSRLGASFGSYDLNGNPTRFFSRNSSLISRQVTLRTTVSDAIGLYDIALVNSSIISPKGSVYLASTPLTLIQGFPVNYTGIWSLNFTYATSDTSGNYLSNLGITDNSGVSVSQQLSLVLYATWSLAFRTMSLDPVPSPVPGTLVTVYSSGTPVFSGISNSSGIVVPGSVLLRDNVSYYITSYWEGTLVNQTGTFGLTASATLTLSLSVYTVNFGNAFKDGSGNLLSQPPASFHLTSQVNGSTTTPNPSGTYLLQAGLYTISSVIWDGVDVTPSGGVSFNPRYGTPSIDLQIYSLTILAVDQNGQAVSSAQVTVTKSSQTIAQGTTGSDGSLNFPDLPGGQYIIQVKSQSQSASATVTLTQNTSQRVQIIPAAPPSSSWIAQSWEWFVLVGAAIGGIIGYRQVSRSRLAFREEPFEYLNSLTGGGFKEGDTILIVGDQGTGKTMVCEELAYQYLTRGSAVVFLTYEAADGVRDSMKRFRWDPTEWESRNKFQLLQGETTQAGAVSFGMVENFYGVTVLSLSINTALGQVPAGQPIVFIDSLTGLAETSSASALVNVILDLSMHVKTLKGQLFLTISRSTSKTLLSRIEEASDGVLELAQVVDDGKPAVDLRVKKMRGRKYETKPVRLKVDQKKGFVFEVRRTLAVKNRRAGSEETTARRTNHPAIGS